MITSAAVKIADLRQDKEIIIPCHRHCDAFKILKDFNYHKNKDYFELGQGFLDENDNYYDRISAKKHAQECHQIIDTNFGELYSEDLW